MRFLPEEDSEIVNWRVISGVQLSHIECSTRDGISHCEFSVLTPLDMKLIKSISYLTGKSM